MSRLRSASLLSWIGLLAAPFAFTAQHVAGIAVTQARCGDGYAVDRGVPLHTVTVAVAAVALTVALAGEAAAILAWRRTRDTGDDPPPSRIHFVSVMGLTFSPLFAVIILMSSLGAVLLPQCLQS
jgi:hypothetical protein